MLIFIHRDDKIKKGEWIIMSEKKSEDKRIGMTKTMLKDALIELMKEKSIIKLNIKEVCARAGVNRTTFYNHYESHFELYDDILRDIFEDIKKKMDNLGNRKLIGTQPDMSRAFLTEVFSYAEENRELLLVILSQNGMVSVGEAFSEWIDKYLLMEKATTFFRYRIQFVAAGVSNILWLWLNEPERMPAEDMAGLISVLYDKGIVNAIRSMGNEQLGLFFK